MPAQTGPHIPYVPHHAATPGHAGVSRHAAPPRRRWPVRWSVLLLALGLVAVALYVLRPPVQPPVAGVQVILGGRPVGWAESSPSGAILLPLKLVQQEIDPALRYIADSKKLQTSTSPWRLPMRDEGVERFVQERSVTIEFRPGWGKRGPAVPVEALLELYGLHMEVVRGEEGRLRRVLFDWVGNEVPVLRNSAPLRLRARPWPWWPGPLMPAGSLFKAYAKVGGWVLVRSGDGRLGYLPEGAVTPAGTWKAEREPRPAPLAVDPPVCLVWEHVLRPEGPDLSTIGSLPGVKVVSPTWLHLAAGDGSLSSGCDLEYVRWAHGRGYAVWVLVGNDFDPDLTRQVLQDRVARQHLIRQLLVYSRLFALDGINVDFENVYLSEKQAFTRFVQELSEMTRAEGLTVSVDVTIKSSSPNWSLFLDRRALARHADYLAVMTYDEHYAGSPRAGSVASLPWVEKGIQGLLEEVPAQRLLLGIPFYTRLWKEEKGPEGRTKVSSRALGMADAEAAVAAAGAVPVYDAKSGQDYAEWTQEGATYRIWLENERSLQSRVQLVNRYGLAGVACWRRGFEREDIWPFMAAHLRR